jgi:RHS repeat-associated protein
MKMRHTILVLFGLLSCFRGMPVLAVETTIYVDRHFEVRDHDQPTKYVFNGGTRVARITGSLSTNARMQRFRLHSGWNLLSLAVSATNLSEQLQRPGVVASVFSWNPQTANYLALAPGAVSAGTILWVNATTNATIAVTGTYSDPVNRAWDAGATYLAGAGLEAWSPVFPATMAVWTFSPQPLAFSLSSWLGHLTGDLSSINDLPKTFPPGQVLYVINNAPFELEIPDAALRVRYYHQDHLGSSSVMTDASGVLVEETAFYPFGIPRHEHRLRQIEEAYKFTQKERDRESGLHHFEARYLAGAMSRFLSADPMYANTDSSAGDPQAMNLYAYVRNNPLQYTDPTGLQPVPDLEKIRQDALNRSNDTPAAEKSCGASFSAGFGDSILPKLTLWGPASFLTGLLGPSLGPSFEFGPEGRGLFGINNVDEDSGCYTAGGVAQTLTSFAVGPRAFGAAQGGSTSVKALGGGGGPLRPLRAATTVEMPAQPGTVGPATHLTRAQTIPGHTPFPQYEKGMTLGEYHQKLFQHNKASTDALVKLTGEQSSARQMMEYNFKLAENVKINQHWAETILKNAGD